uniref:Uncharacterized protein n=1 Tax=Timema genevievae TaxID=629358 RepID=A0A7R9K4N3_TIMGE|nr:unnamed protein product [Timema genevievae]
MVRVHRIKPVTLVLDWNDYNWEIRILILAILVKCRLLQRILDAWDDNESQSSCQGRRRGYMGHLIKIANHILNASEKGTLSSFITENVSPDVVDAWEAFVLNQLAEINKSNQLCLGGVHPALSSSEDGNKEFSNVPFHQGAEVQQHLQNTFPQRIAIMKYYNAAFAVVHTIDTGSFMSADIAILINNAKLFQESHFATHY